MSTAQPAKSSSRGSKTRSSSVTSKLRVQIGEYLLGKTLGIGSFGKVKLAEHVITGQLVAIKVLNKSRIKTLDMEEKVRREIQILKMFVHPHIIRLYEVIETPTDIFLVMEYVSGGELFDYIVSKERLHIDEARQFFQQIVSGVAYCHNRNVVHRDLKPENLLLSADNNVKVADFGLSNIMYDGEFLRTSCGSPNYAAPEVISGNLYAGPEVDIWSCGVILYALLCGSLPFDDDSIPRLFRKIRNGHYVLPSFLDEASRDLIPRMLVVDPTQRIKIEEIRQHPFFTKGLPPYLALPIGQQSLACDGDEINEECVSEILRLNHPFIKKNGRAGVIMAITSRRKTFIQVIYNLYLDQMQTRIRVAEQRASTNKRLVEEAGLHTIAFSPPSAPKSAPTGANYRDPTKRWSENISTSPHTTSSRYAPASVPGKQHKTPTSSSVPRTYKDSEQPQTSTASGNGAPGAALTGIARNRARSANRMRKWYLGIQSKKDPELVMSEVFRALKSLRSQWHYAPSNPYRVTCRWRPSCLGVFDETVPDEWVYVSLQLYKVQNSIYLLDFQRVGGISGSFSFMRLCSLIINALKAPAGSSSSASSSSSTSGAASPAAALQAAR